MHPSFPQAHVWVPHIIRFLRPIEHVKFLLIDETKDALLSLQSDETERIYMLECLKLTFGCWTPEFQAALMQTEVQPMESFPKTWFTFLLMLYETMITHPYQAPDRLEYDQWRWIKVPDETVSYYNHQLKFICPAWHAGLRSPRWDRYYKDIAVYKLVSSPSSEGGVCTTHSFLQRAKDVSFTDVVRALRARDLTAKQATEPISSHSAQQFMQAIRESQPYRYMNGWQGLSDVFMALYDRLYPESELDEEFEHPMDAYLAPELWLAPFLSRLLLDICDPIKLKIAPADYFKELHQFDPKQPTREKLFGIDVVQLMKDHSEIFSRSDLWDFSVQFGQDRRLDTRDDAAFFAGALEHSLHIWIHYEEHVVDLLREYINDNMPCAEAFNFKQDKESLSFLQDNGSSDFGVVELGLPLHDVGPQVFILGKHGGVLFDRHAEGDNAFAYYWRANIMT
eukprot:Blabericola_migrator_1__7898@NODE_403_length_8845_cov_279_760424_g25_i1_p3_GENE_NODE_403_length_8845_cov_279_760424_g25_i1NODE_403_length_8845_cov_279_760424_g25_i1_p3_ORF_typecomplete_len452_score74_71Gemini_AL1_M/PF08283_11/6_6e03Gemini_AL1_M/PF08283_11/0_0077HAUSaugmin3/PF14932_6/0_35_NODE_403_length_8845_cov_279_760424_g25_i172478602